jgi:flagellar motility protein MotE (MotC chaperone)
LKKISLFILIIVIFLLAGLFASFLVTNLSLRTALGDLENKKEAELKSKIAQERELIRKDLDEKYRADLVSFEAMAKRLEIEKKRLKDLEEKMQKLEENTTHTEKNLPGILKK